MQKKVIIFGSDGQLGFDLVRVFKGYEVIALNRQAADVTNQTQVEDIIAKAKPDIIINATAYNKVDLAEQEVAQAFSVNAFAPFYMAKAAKEVGAIFIHVSTDYVFDGEKGIYIETDEPNPLNMYGLSKLEGEQMVKSAEAKFYIIRTSAVFGKKQSGQKLNFVEKILDQAKKGQEIKVISDQITSPTYSFDLATKIKELIEKPAPFGLYHITNEGSCSWFEFAEKIIELMNIRVKIIAISSKELNLKAKRPQKSVLMNEALEKSGISAMPSWEDALARYNKE